MIRPKGPFPASALLGYLSRRLSGRERIEGDCYIRETPAGELRVGVGAALSFPERSPSPDEIQRLTFLFQTDCDWSPPEVFLRDPVLGPLVAQAPGFRPLGCWDPFELCLRTVVGQQVSVAAARTLMKRVTERADTAEGLVGADLGALGMPGRRVETIRALAQKAASGGLPWHDWPALRTELAATPGFGPWTLDYLGIRLGRDLDAFPEADLGLMRAAGCRTKKELLARAEPWRPFRGWAAAYLWSM